MLTFVPFLSIVWVSQRTTESWCRSKVFTANYFETRQSRLIDHADKTTILPTPISTPILASFRPIAIASCRRSLRLCTTEFELFPPPPPVLPILLCIQYIYDFSVPTMVESAEGICNDQLLQTFLQLTHTVEWHDFSRLSLDNKTDLQMF